MKRFRYDYKKDEIDYVRFLNHMHINQNDRNSERKIRMEFGRLEKDGTDVDKIFRKIPEKVYIIIYLRLSLSFFFFFFLYLYIYIFTFFFICLYFYFNSWTEVKSAQSFQRMIYLTMMKILVQCSKYVIVLEME